MASKTKEYAITVSGTASFRETWKVRATKPPTVDEAREMLQQQSGGIEFVSDQVTGDEERDYESVEVEEF